MSLLVAEIEKIIEEFSTENIFMVDTIIGGTPKTPKITVIIDSDKGVTIQECTNVSRKLNKYLGEVIYVDNNYTLEITSPGADKPIKVNRQYNKNVGRKFKVIFNDDRELEGNLQKVEDDGIVLLIEKIEKIEQKKVKSTSLQKILFTEIKKANVIITI